MEDAVAVAASKRCSMCKEVKAVEKFYPDRSRKSDRLQGHCIECHAAHKSSWQRNNREKNQAYYRLSKYGLTPEAYDALVNKFNGKCYATACPNPGTDVDHCHATNKVRGWLCNGCNTSLGRLKDSPARIRSLATYLKVYGHTNTPPKEATWPSSSTPKQTDFWQT